MNNTAALDVVVGEDLGFGMALEDGNETVNQRMAKNFTSIYFSMKSNNSELADCSQTILMEEIKVIRTSCLCFYTKTFYATDI